MHRLRAKVYVIRPSNSTVSHGNLSEQNWILQRLHHWSPEVRREIDHSFDTVIEANSDPISG